MNAYDLICKIDNMRSGRRPMAEDNIPAPVAKPPSHAPTSSGGYATAGTAKSDDEGEPVRKAYKQPSGSIPAPVAKPPSHAPTSSGGYATAGTAKSDDEGEEVKKAMKEAADLLGVDPNDLWEGRHKPGCQCGFCKNKGSKGKKASDDSDVLENRSGGSWRQDPNCGTCGKPISLLNEPKENECRCEFRMNANHRLGCACEKCCQTRGGSRMNFRQRVPPKACINPHQPAMEQLDAASDADAAIQRMADRLLEAPGAD